MSKNVVEFLKKSQKLKDFPDFIQRSLEYQPLYSNVCCQGRLQRLWAVDLLKEQGNCQYKQNQVKQAIQIYEKALSIYCYLKATDKQLFAYIQEGTTQDEMKIKQILFLNLAACYLKQQEYLSTKWVCLLALQIDAYNYKALYRLAKARLSLPESIQTMEEIVAAQQELISSKKLMQILPQNQQEKEIIEKELINAQRILKKLKNNEEKKIQQIEQTSTKQQNQNEKVDLVELKKQIDNLEAKKKEFKRIEQQLKNDSNSSFQNEIEKNFPQTLSSLTNAITVQQKQLQQIYDSELKQKQKKSQPKKTETQNEVPKIKEETKQYQQFDNDIEKYFQKQRKLQENEEFNYQLSFEQDPNVEIPPELKELQYFLDVQSKDIVKYYLNTGQSDKAKELEMKLQKAQAARVQLEKISRLDFKKPTQQLSLIAKNYNLDLLDPQIQNELKKIQQQNIKDIRDLLDKLNNKKTNNYYINNTFITSNVETNNKLVTNISVDNSKQNEKQKYSKKHSEARKKKKLKNQEKLDEQIKIEDVNSKNNNQRTFWPLGLFILLCSVAIYLILKYQRQIQNNQ